jgi:ribosome-associated protein
VSTELDPRDRGGPASAETEVKVLTRQLAESAERTRAPKLPIADASAEEAHSSRLLDLITSSLDQDGAEDILDIPLAGKSTVADYMVIASGRSTRHVAAIAEKLVERLKAETGIRSRVEGRETADWVLIDAGDVIVHIFRPEVRAFYQLEKMWLATPDRTARPA